MPRIPPGGFGVTRHRRRPLFDLAHTCSPPATTSGGQRRSSSTCSRNPRRQPRASAPSAVWIRPANYVARAAPRLRVSHAVWLPNVRATPSSTFRAGLQNTCEDPFRTIRRSSTTTAKVIPVDFHAARRPREGRDGWYVDGRVTVALAPTPTSPPPTNVLPGGTAYQTDVGMSCPYDSVIGVEKELVLARFLTGMPGKFEAARNDARMCATLIGCDGATGRATTIQRFMLGE